MKAVILAGGHGTRLAEETHRVPKPMVEIGGRPILWHIMRWYGHHNINEFIICLGYKGYVVKEYFSNFLLHSSDVDFNLATGEVEMHTNRTEPWRVSLVDTGDKTMTGGRLKRIAPHLGHETFCMTYGDGLSDVDVTEAIRFHQSHGKLATVTAVRPPGRFGVLDVENRVVKSILEKPEQTESFINGGFFVLEPGALDTIDGDDVFWEREPMSRLAQRSELMAFEHRGFWQSMDTLREKQLLEELWASGKAPWRAPD